MMWGVKLVPAEPGKALPEGLLLGEESFFPVPGGRPRFFFWAASSSPPAMPCPDMDPILCCGAPII